MAQPPASRTGARTGAFVPSRSSARVEYSILLRGQHCTAASDQAALVGTSASGVSFSIDRLDSSTEEEELMRVADTASGCDHTEARRDQRSASSGSWPALGRA